MLHTLTLIFVAILAGATGYLINRKEVASLNSQLVQWKRDFSVIRDRAEALRLEFKRTEYEIFAPARRIRQEQTRSLDAC